VRQLLIRFICFCRSTVVDGQDGRPLLGHDIHVQQCAAKNGEILKRK
jgi:hypothetical protein